MIPVMVLPTLTRHDLAVQMLASIDCEVGLLVIVNNHPSANFDAFGLVPRCVQDYRVYDMPANLGVAGSWNLGIKCAPFAPWWMVVSDDVVFAPGALAAFADKCLPNVLTVSNEWPHYQFFGVGEEVVSEVGLFDENLYPANFEDDDFQRRCEAAGLQVLQVGVPHTHVKQGTVHAPEWAAQNTRTFAANESYYKQKILHEDFSPGEWSLDIRRANDWSTNGTH